MSQMSHVMNLFVSCPQIGTESLNPMFSVFEDRAFKGLIILKRGHMSVLSMMGVLRKGISTEERPHEDVEKRQP